MSRSESHSRIATCAFALAGLIAAAAPSHAYRMIQDTTIGRSTSGTPVSCTNSGGFAHWQIRAIPWYVNLGSQSSDKRTAIDDAMMSWFYVPLTDYYAYDNGTTTAGFTTDGQNTIDWESNSACSGSCLAVTALVLQYGQVIVESDIAFNPSYSFYTNGSQFDTQSVATHELGHTFGIHHTESTASSHPTMYAAYFGIDARSLTSDDMSALQCSENRYPVPPVCTTDPDCEQACSDQKFSCDGGGLQDANEQARCDDTYNLCMSYCTVCS